MPPWEITVPTAITVVTAALALGRHLQKQSTHESEINRLRSASQVQTRPTVPHSLSFDALRTQLEDCRTRLDALTENYRAHATSAEEIQTLRAQVQTLRIRMEARDQSRNTDSIRNGLAAVQLRVAELEERMSKTEAALARHDEKFTALETNFNRLYTETFPTQNKLIDARFDAAAEARSVANEAIKRIEKKLDRLIGKLT